jgi:Streptomyces sporulation and cell division protein, SsgA
VVTVRTNNVVSSVEFALVLADARRVKVAARLCFDARDPFAVSMSFDAGGAEPVEWTFARDLLDQGLWQAVGDGDVKVWPHHGAVFLALCSPSGKAILETRRRAVADFIARIERLVPAGHEADQVDVDRELESLLS